MTDTKGVLLIEKKLSLSDSCVLTTTKNLDLLKMYRSFETLLTCTRS